MWKRGRRNSCSVGGAKRLSVLEMQYYIRPQKLFCAGDAEVLESWCWNFWSGWWYLSSLPPSVRLGCFARLFLCLHVGAVSQPSIRPKFSISYRSWWARNLSVTSWNLWGFCIHWIECLLLRSHALQTITVCQASLKRGVNGTCAVAHLYLNQV